VQATALPGSRRRGHGYRLVKTLGVIMQAVAPRLGAEIIMLRQFLFGLQAAMVPVPEIGRA
jgi:hypothetical protein